MFHRLVALAMRELHVSNRHVVLEVDEGFVRGLVGEQGARGNKSDAGVIFQGGCGVFAGMSMDGRGLGACLPARGNRVLPGLAAHHGARAKLGAVKTAGHKTGNVAAVDRFDIAVGAQVHGGRPTARHGHQVHVQLHGATHDGSGGGVVAGNAAALGMQAAVNISHRAAGLHGDTCAGCSRQQAGLHHAAQVHHIDLRSGTRQCQGVSVGGIVVHTKHGAFARCDGIAVDIGAHRAREHDARLVIARKHQRPLNRAAGHDDGVGAHRAHALAWHAVGGVGLARGGAFNHTHGIAVVNAESRGAGQHAHLARGLQFGQHGRKPLAFGTIGGLTEQCATQGKVLLHQHDLATGAGGIQCGAESRRAGADDQHVGVVVVPVVAVHIGVIDGCAQTGRFANEMLVEHPCMAGGAHESLVIKPGHEKRRQHRGDGHGVEFDGRPGVLGAGAKPLFELQHGGCNIGLVRALGANRQQRVGFFDTGGHDAPRAVVFE